MKLSARLTGNLGRIAAASVARLEALIREQAQQAAHNERSPDDTNDRASAKPREVGR
jgi:hypothetical protein